jgi:hypothetical protein
MRSLNPWPRPPRRLVRLVCAFILASPAAAARPPRRLTSEAPRDRNECLQVASRDEAAAAVLRSKAFRGLKEIASVRLLGLRAVSEDSLWQLAGGRPHNPLAPEEVVALLARLARTELFSAIAPAVTPGDDDGVGSLEVELVEHPSIRSVQVRGLSEFRTEDIVDRLLESPSRGEVERSRREVREALPRECPAPLPPLEWLARSVDGEMQPGILREGIRAALERVTRHLRNRGYPLARLDGSLGSSGVLHLDVDEGRVARVEVRGLAPRLAREAEAELRLERGEVFSTGELHSALARVERRWPFVRPDRRGRRSPPLPSLRIDAWPDGTVEFRTERAAEPRRAPRKDAEDDRQRRRDQGDDDDSFDDADDWLEGPRARIRRSPPKDESRRGWYGFEGETLVVYLRADRSRAEVQWIELLRHTPVTGFAPGLATTATIYDPQDRVHLSLDGAVNVNTRRPSRDVTGGTFLERLNAQERVDWLLGTRLRIPVLALAEVGGQIHTLTDTADRFRISRIDSYLYSALINRADREYYRRSGYAAFLTAHLYETVTLGAEYHLDRYAPLAAPRGVWTLFNRDDPRYGSAPVDEGEMGSLVFRGEYQSEKVPLHRVGSMWRNPETSLVEPEPGAIGLRSVNTVEVADRSLGGIFEFTKVVSDSSLALETGRHDTLTLRLRAAGGRGLALQKQEGLGGWTALRGYDFKEFRGDASVLGTLQFEGRHFGAFLDVGSVRNAGNWLDPKPSAGALFSFAEGSTRVEAAWRLDGRAKLLPDFRILFAVPL